MIVTNLWIVLVLCVLWYVLWAAFLIILDNRRPQSTYGWLLAFVAFPIIGLLVY